MIRTIISLERKDKAWLDRKASEEKVSRAELIRRAVRTYREASELESRSFAELAAGLRRRSGWKLPDALQAAVARYHGLRLATRNVRDFPPDRYDFVEVPYQL